MAWAEQRANGQWTGIYRDPAGRKRSAGTVLKKKDAQALAQREEDKIRLGGWVDPAAVNGQLKVPAGGQVKVPTLRVDSGVLR
jgi:hypothetical protein